MVPAEQIAVEIGAVASVYSDINEAYDLGAFEQFVDAPRRYVELIAYELGRIVPTDRGNRCNICEDYRRHFLWRRLEFVEDVAGVLNGTGGCEPQDRHVTLR